MYFSPEVLQYYLDAGLISEQIHPDAPYVRIYNYTAHCQYENAWDYVTAHCRGLILDTQQETVLAHPFPKFFNYDEHIQKGFTFPNEPPVITEKLDGSLGILYWLHGQPWIATRGSFVSEQAQWATQWFRRYVTWEFGLPVLGVTHLFEIIYKQNRIVVDYGEFEGLVHIAARDTCTGREFIDHPLPPTLCRATRLAATDYQALKELERPNAEGFVILFPQSGIRVKVKFQEYVRLHKIITGLSEKAIWELLSTGQDLERYIERVPDEFYQWFEVTKNNLLTAFQYIWAQVDREWLGVAAFMREHGYAKEQHRKEIAAEILKRTYPKMLFALLDGRRFDEQIWKLIKPKGATVFKNTTEEV